MILLCVSSDAFGKSSLRGSGSGLVGFIETLGGCFSTCLVLIVAVIPLCMVGSLVCDIHAVIGSIFFCSRHKCQVFLSRSTDFPFSTILQRVRSRVTVFRYCLL